MEPTMYIGVKEESIVFCQMELVDYVNPEQKTILDLENPQDQRAASRILKPKGLNPKRRKRKKKKKGNATQLPLNFIKKRPKSKQKSKLKIEPKSKPKSKQISKPKSTIESVIPPIPALLRSSSTSELSELLDSKKPPSPPPSESSKISEELISKFGHSGEIPVPCPICEEDLLFYPMDLDSVSMGSTRLCDCGAIVRITTRQYYLRIFHNLGILPAQFDDEVVILPTEHHDFNGNMIFSYGIHNE
ncbi:MAG: hypothetical protein ACTSYI_14525 [Promethearchaeota archaeon]